MRRREGVVDIEIPQPGERGGEIRVVRLLAGMEAQVLQERHLARAEIGERRLGLGANADPGEDDPAAGQPLGQGCDQQRERQRRHPRALRPAQVRDQNDPGAAARQLLDGRHAARDPGRVADPAAGQGHVEIDPDQDASAAHVQLVQGLEGAHGPLLPMVR